METARPERRISTEQLRRATTTIALAQAQIGVAVIGLLGASDPLTPDDRAKLSAEVEESVNGLIKLADQLLGPADGS